MKKTKIIGIVFFLFLFLVGGFFCLRHFKENEIMEEENIPVVEEKKLTILDLNSKSRPVAVMINNLGTARNYHRGLQDAYLVYEMIVEGGITRLMALYKDSKVASIGSVRSARPYYLDYVLENDAIYVHWGYSEQASMDIKSLGINNINGLSYEKQFFWRDRSLKVPSEHTGYTSMEKINSGIQYLNYRNTSNVSPLLNYSVDSIDYSTLEGVVPADKIDIKYSGSVTTHYDYDAEKKVYTRSVNGAPHTDYDTKQQYTAKNIITYTVRNSTIPGDTKGRQTLSNVGSGEGYYISEGFAVPITWQKMARNAKTIYRLLDGTELKVNDGNTYIQIQPVGQTLTIS